MHTPRQPERAPAIDSRIAPTLKVQPALGCAQCLAFILFEAMREPESIINWLVVFDLREQEGKEVPLRV